MSLNALASCLSARYNDLGAALDLDEAIAHGREARELCSQGHPLRPMLLSDFAMSLWARSQQLGTIEDLDEAIVLNREALSLCLQGHPGRPMALNNLAMCLGSRFQQSGGVVDLEEAIGLSREALQLCPQGHPGRPMPLNSLASSLMVRYDQLGAEGDLDEAVVLNREAVELCPQGHPGRSVSLNSLSGCLCQRYNQLGVVEDLNEAILLGREALALRPQGTPQRPFWLNSLGGCLQTRYNQLGAVVDIDEAIVFTREALELCPQGHPGRILFLSNLAFGLSSRYKQFGAVLDLDEAIVLNRKVLELHPQGHPDRSRLLNNLAECLLSRYQQLGAVVDLEEAIVLNRKALELRQQGHVHRSLSLNNLASCLSTRCNQFGAVVDLDEAILLSREALELRPHNHPDRSESLKNLAGYLHIRFARSGQVEDKEVVFSLYLQLLDIPHVVSSADLSAARAWISAAESFQDPSTLLAYETSLRLLVQLLSTLPSLPQHLDVLKKVTSSLAVDAFSACLRNHAAARAVELLEQGRGVFWSQLTRLRFPLDDVIASGPDGQKLAEEFSRLTSRIRTALNSPDTDQHGQVYHLNIELNRVVTDIRKLPRFSHFLLPLPFSDLQHAASGGPVIIVNASQYSCDAIVVLLDRDPVHIPLRITQQDVRKLSTDLRTLTIRARKVDVKKELAVFLRNLWEQIVSPIVDFLRTVLPPGSRIWWCPTAEFSLLPLHAASPYRKGQRSLSQIYISSYTPTLSALIRTRRPASLNAVDDGTHIVAIGQANAVGETKLFSVSSELAIVGQSVDGLATFTQIEGSESCISRVAEEIGRNQWVHFACHGIPNREKPFESAFALHDGRFTIQRIIQCEPEDPQFAYLSACHTTVGDEESPDEVIHLASAMQFSGFRSVIGTMWAVDDGHTNQITSTFYKHMVDESGRLDHTRAAYALNKTMKSVKVPLDQEILYIHLGA